MPPKKAPAAPKENISLGPQVREGKSINPSADLVAPGPSPWFRLPFEILEISQKREK